MTILSKWILVSLALLGTFAFAQQTAKLVGTVSDSDGNGLPGVVILLESEAMLGTRSLVSQQNGEFIATLLPPGNYTLTASMAGMSTVKQTFYVGVSQTTRPSITMTPEATMEAMVVTASVDATMDTAEVAANFDQDVVTQLPTLNRGQLATAYLAPGASASGPDGALSISGAQSFENLFILNGGVMNVDNIRGEPPELPVEDAIQETTVTSGNISAEYGQFTGGVINTITKSGGNQFSGSLRLNLSNDSWRARTPLELESGADLESKLNKEYSLTVGGPILKDRLWFFVSAFQTENTVAGQLLEPYDYDAEYLAIWGLTPADIDPNPGVRNFDATREDEKWEIKLTGKLYEGHELAVSYLDRSVTDLNYAQAGVQGDWYGVTPSRELPQSLISINYRGIITPNFSIDATYAKREFQFAPYDRTNYNTGDVRLDGTIFVDYWYTGAEFNSNRYGGDPDPKERNTTTYGLKGSYFLTTDNMGSHDITFGYQDMNLFQRENNTQNASGFLIWADGVVFMDGEAVPLFGGPNLTLPIYWDIHERSVGAEFQTSSFYVNDSWTFNENWAFNLGVRYDKNDQSDQSGNPTSTSDNVSPRLGIEYDLEGDGTHVFSASYSQYVAQMQNSSGNASTAGTNRYIYWMYLGDPIMGLDNFFEWFDENIGPDPTGPGAFEYPGYIGSNLVDPDNPSVVIRDSLESPYVGEFRIGYRTRLSDRGFIRLDYIHREYDNYLTNFVSQEIGNTNNGNANLTLIANDKEGLYKREYDGIQIQGSYRLMENFTLSGNYTWSDSQGNFRGESESGGEFTPTTLTSQTEWNAPQSVPYGPIQGTMDHVLRLFAIYDLNTSFGDFNFSLQQRYQSGQHYSASFTPRIGNGTDWGFVDPDDTTYASTPATFTYFVDGERGGFKSEALTQTDLGINYTFSFFDKVEAFIEIDVINLFNQDAAHFQEHINKSVNAVAGETWNVFNETPVEGVHYNFSNSFGEAQQNDVYQLSRRYQIDFGFRF